MHILEYLTVGAAVFLAAAWAFGLVMSPRDRIGSTILTVVIWWAALTAWLFGNFSAFHLLWLYPLGLFAPALLLAGRL